jgi:hypothetical protein
VKKEKKIRKHCKCRRRYGKLNREIEMMKKESNVKSLRQRQRKE